MIINAETTEAGRKYLLCEGDTVLAEFPDFTTAALVCRFIKAGRLEKPEYDRVMEAMRGFDATC